MPAEAGLARRSRAMNCFANTMNCFANTKKEGARGGTLGSPTSEQPLVMGVVDAAMAPRVAAKKPPSDEDRPLQEPVLTQSVKRVLRAGRVVLAAVAEHGTDRPAVDPNETGGRIPWTGPNEIDCSSYSQAQG